MNWPTYPRFYGKLLLTASKFVELSSNFDNMDGVEAAARRGRRCKFPGESIKYIYAIRFNYSHIDPSRAF